MARWNPYEEKSPGDLPPPAFKELRDAANTAAGVKR